jgi:hypothetical protein
MRHLVAPGLLILLASCAGDEPVINDPISNIPSLDIVSVTPQTVTEYEDSIVFTLFYQDGDGDLGHADPDSASLFLVDTRIGTTESYFVPLLAPENAVITIQGELLLTLDRTILIDADSESETVYFQIYLKDRAGNISNIAISPAITVLPQ